MTAEPNPPNPSDEGGAAVGRLDGSDSKYLAFISYAHADDREAGKAWAHWLRDSIDQFKVPKSLIGEESEFGTVSSKIGKVMFDGDFSVGGTIDGTIEKELLSSKFLVIICSPNSARSSYVGTEIKSFYECNGADRILMVVVDGDHRRASEARVDGEECCINEELFDAFKEIDDDLPLFVDFRPFHIKEKRKYAGWTDPLLFGETPEVRDYTKRLRHAIVSSYERDHRNARLKLMGPLLGVETAVLSNEVRLEEERQGRRQLARWGMLSALLLLVLAVVIWLALGYRREQQEALRLAKIAEQQQLRSERSLLMIGDAHKAATRMASGLVVSLMDNGLDAADSGPFEEAISDGRRIVLEYYEDALAVGPDEPDLMHATYLSERGHFYLEVARQLGKTPEMRLQSVDHFESAEISFQEALKIRKGHADRNPGAGLHLHNLASGYDSMGDYHAARALFSEAAEQDGHYEAARELYGLGRTASESLEASTDPPPNWQHDVAVSHYKEGEILRITGDFEGGVASLKKGREVLKKASAGNSQYRRWTAEVARFDLSIAKMCLKKSAREESRAKIVELDRIAKTHLDLAKGVLDKLSAEKRLTQAQQLWLEEVDKLLNGLEYLNQ